MKIQRLFTKNLWVALVVGTVMVWTVFRLAPTLAYSPSTTITTPPAQISTAGVTIAQNDDYSNSGSGSLYQRLGGYDAIAAVIDKSLTRIVNDPKIKVYFVGLSDDSKKKLRQLLVDQLCQAARGPCKYTGRTMKVSHGGLGLDDSEFQAFVGDIAATLDEFNVPEPEKSRVLAFYNKFEPQIVEK